MRPSGGILLLNGLAMGAFAAPNRAGVMNSLPPQHRGVGSGMNSTFQNSAQVLSIGIFFTLMIVGLSGTLPGALYHGLVAHGVPASVALSAAHLPPVSTLFAAFLGYSPVQHLIGTSVLAGLPAHQAAVLTGRGFFPSLISGPFASGLHAAFDFAIGACLAAAGMSWLRGGKYHYRENAEYQENAERPARRRGPGPNWPRPARGDLHRGDLPPGRRSSGLARGGQPPGAADEVGPSGAGVEGASSAAIKNVGPEQPDHRLPAVRLDVPGAAAPLRDVLCYVVASGAMHPEDPGAGADRCEFHVQTTVMSPAWTFARWR